MNTTDEEEFDYEAELQKMQAIIAGYPGDTFIPEVFLIDYLLDYEGFGVESACTSVGMFFGYFYIQKCGFGISIPDAIKQLGKFLDHLAEKGYVEAADCEIAKLQMKQHKKEWIRQERDYFMMDYDAYNEKYWGISGLL